jgi:nitrite reductase/ring-hydroxylating ferredoxin subunit
MSMTMTMTPPPLLWNTLPNAPTPGTLLCHRDSLADGQVLMHNTFATDDTAQAHLYPLLLLRNGDHVRAFVNRCAHFGVPLAARQDLLLFKPFDSITCNVHYARYRWADGLCDRGDCEGESLIAVPVECDATGAVRIASGAPKA